MSENTGIMASNFMSVTMKVYDHHFLSLAVFHHCSGPQLPSESRVSLSSKYSPTSARTVPREKEKEASVVQDHGQHRLPAYTPPLQGWGGVRTGLWEIPKETPPPAPFLTALPRSSLLPMTFR